MPRGGKRPGAGAKPTRPPVKRRLMLELSADEADDLEELRVALPGMTAAEIIRYALRCVRCDMVG